MGPSTWVERAPRCGTKTGQRAVEEAVRDALLARRYCKADCLLDAEARGYPRWKLDRIVALMEVGVKKAAKAKKEAGEKREREA
jgi:hypothetical protein